jgi:hypothetical protein
MPQISATADGVVIRNLIYSFADISSKAVYGIMLAIIAQKLSAREGYAPAIEAEKAFSDDGFGATIEAQEEVIKEHV